MKNHREKIKKIRYTFYYLSHSFIKCFYRFSVKELNQKGEKRNMLDGNYRDSF